MKLKQTLKQIIKEEVSNILREQENSLPVPIRRKISRQLEKLLAKHKFRVRTRQWSKHRPSIYIGINPDEEYQSFHWEKTFDPDDAERRLRNLEQDLNSLEYVQSVEYEKPGPSGWLGTRGFIITFK